MVLRRRINFLFVDIRRRSVLVSTLYFNKHFLDAEHKCFESGMNDIVAKPMNLEALEHMLKEHDRRKTGNRIVQVKIPEEEEEEVKENEP